MNDSDLMSESEVISDSDAITDHEAIMGHDTHNFEDGLHSPVELFSPLGSDWRRTHETVMRAVVSLHFVHVDKFDTNSAKATQATGFVVDTEKCYILTNRHVSSSGRILGYCTFSNHEEADVEVVYFDPIHDFAFLRYDKSTVRHANVQALELRPEAARVGLEVRIVGNDCSQVLSISPAIISRLDRNAEIYGSDAARYSDFNTNYLQATSAARGGSSGSPVVDSHGSVVAMQAGGNYSATNYFLPLQRVVRALDLLRQGKVISRGTIQTHWKLEPLAICKRLGLSLEEEASVRSVYPGTNTMLVAETVLPHGPADGKIARGDLLLKVNGTRILSFVELEDILDTHIGQSIDLDIRRGNQDLKVSVRVGDLDELIPNRFVMVAGAIFQDFSYLLANGPGIPCKGVYMADNGRFTNLPKGVLIKSIQGRDMPDLQTFVDYIRKLKDTTNVQITFSSVSDLQVQGTEFVSWFRCWHPKIQMWTRNKDYERWGLTEFDFAPEKRNPIKKFKTVTVPVINGLKDRAAEYIANTVVKVKWTGLITINGHHQPCISDHGIIADKCRGLVIVSRATVPHKMCDIMLTIADVEIPAHVVFLHPLHNYALLQYDPAKIDTPVESVVLSEEPLRLKEKVTLISVQRSTGIKIATETSIVHIDSFSMPTSLEHPRYRAINFEALEIGTKGGPQTSFGVLTLPGGSVGALYLTFNGRPSSVNANNANAARASSVKYGLQACQIREVIEKIRDGTLATPRILDIQLRSQDVVKARKLGVPEQLLHQLPSYRGRNLVYSVKKLSCRPGGESNVPAERLEEDDVIIAIDDKLVIDVSMFGALYSTESVKAVIYRRKKKLTIDIPTTSIEHLETSRAVSCCGAILHPPHHTVRQLIRSLPSEVYVSRRTTGSPAHLYKLAPVQFITHINDTETPDLDTFIKIASDIPDNTFFRLRTMSMKLRPDVVTIKKCDRYFPMKVYEVPSAEDSMMTTRPRRRGSKAQ